MPDAFDEELDKGPEGSIIQPIFLGCAAMGIGCLFSVAAVALAIFIFFPGIWTLINSVDEESLLFQSLPMVEAHPEVQRRVGSPITTDFLDFDAGEAGGTSVDYNIGDEIDLFNTYRIIGPNGSGLVEARGRFGGTTNEIFEVNSVIVTFDDGEQIRVFPGETDTPPPPQQLAPPSPEIPAIEDAEPEEGASTKPQTPAVPDEDQ